MATGFLSLAVCYESLNEAVDAYFSAKTPFSYFTQNPNKITTISYQPVSGVSGSWLQVTDVGGVVTAVAAVPPPFPSCNAPSEFFTAGVEFGALLVGVLVIGFGFQALSKAL